MVWILMCYLIGNSLNCKSLLKHNRPLGAGSKSPGAVSSEENALFILYIYLNLA